jgi:hypothetical protein
MTKTVAISLLSKGNNGAQILEILDAISQDSEQQSAPVNSVAAPTLEALEF